VLQASGLRAFSDVSKNTEALRGTDRWALAAMDAARDDINHAQEKGLTPSVDCAGETEALTKTYF